MNNKWNLQEKLVKQIIKKGGWVNAHTHLDRAYTISPAMLSLANEHLHKKWSIVDEIKAKSSVAQIYDRMSFAVEQQIKQGVSVLGSFIDVDDVIKDKAIKAAQKVKDKYQDDIKLVFINQALKGVIDPSARKWFDEALDFVDIIGGLPAKDEGREEEHLDVLFESAKRTGKMLHVHVDQLNTKAEKETELLVKKTKQHGWENKVVGIHGISLAAHPVEYRKNIYKKMKDAGVMMISCPTAWIDSRRSEEISVTHNSIAPVEELIANGVVVGIGADNIADVYKPFTDGDMWTELRFMLESCHFYDLPELINISTKNGRKILGVKNE
jgi:cytosine deaminase